MLQPLSSPGASQSTAAIIEARCIHWDFFEKDQTFLDPDLRALCRESSRALERIVRFVESSENPKVFNHVSQVMVRAAS